MAKIISCPTCGSFLKLIQEHGGKSIYNISSRGQVHKSWERIGASDLVICSNNDEHNIPKELEDEVIGKVFLETGE